jgi:hypothetical protein
MAGISSCQLSRAARLDLPEPSRPSIPINIGRLSVRKAQGVANASPHVEILRGSYKKGAEFFCSSVINDPLFLPASRLEFVVTPRGIYCVLPAISPLVSVVASSRGATGGQGMRVTPIKASHISPVGGRIDEFHKYLNLLAY